jgi:hypothetical protein
LTLRVELRNPEGATPLQPPLYENAFIDPKRHLVVSVLVSAGDSFPADWGDQKSASRDPFYTGPDPWTPSRNARFGPNILPALATRGVAEIDLHRWAGRGRFLTAWIAAYWAADNPSQPPLDLVWSVWDLPTRSKDWGPIAVSVPVLTVKDGEWQEPSDGNALAWFGSLPLSARGVYRLGVVNGGAYSATILARWGSGPMPILAGWAGPNDVFNLAALRTEERIPPVGAEGTAYLAVWGTNTDDESAAGGPLILTATQGSTS